MVGVDSNFTSLSKHRSAQFRVFGTVSDLPFRDEAFDLVTANMVVEHLDSPAIQFHEVARVLKPGGLFILHTPNRRGYSTLIARAMPEWIKKTMIRLLEARKEEDVFPTFYRVNTAEEIERTAKVTGFDVGRLRLIVSSASLVIFPPLVACELIWIRILMTRRFKCLRTNIIGILQRRQEIKPQGMAIKDF
jgi:SAM-dependent methyltransferase